LRCRPRAKSALANIEIPISAQPRVHLLTDERQHCEKEQGNDNNSLRFHAPGFYTTPTQIGDAIRWDEEAGLRTGCGVRSQKTRGQENSGTGGTFTGFLSYPVEKIGKRPVCPQVFRPLTTLSIPHEKIK